MIDDNMGNRQLPGVVVSTEYLEASLSKIYTTEVAQNLHWFVLGALLPPIFVYGVASGFILLVHWLYRGFKAS